MPFHNHYWIQAVCRVPNALGKAFAEGSTRQRTSGKKSVGKKFFAERLLSGTRQSLCRVQSRHSAKKSDRHGAGCVSTCLPSAMSEALGKDFLIFFSKFLCRVPYQGGTRQIFFLKKNLCGVLGSGHSAKRLIFF